MQLRKKCHPSQKNPYRSSSAVAEIAFLYALVPFRATKKISEKGRFLIGSYSRFCLIQEHLGGRHSMTGQILQILSPHYASHRIDQIPTVQFRAKVSKE